jgi:CO/xanthine dehydrogenase FAD-binding subunit
MDLNTVTAVLPARVGEWRPGDAWLAGGTVLFSQPDPALRRLLDLTALEWPALTVRDDGLELAATCTIAELRALHSPWGGFDALVEACCNAFVASFKIWNVATVGGNLCAALPAGPMISLTAALDGVCRIRTPDGGRRELPVTEFVTGDGVTALMPGELLETIFLPVEALTGRTAFRQGSLYPLGRSAALLIGRRTQDGTVIAVTASTTRPMRFTDGLDIPDELYVDDVHGLPAWRKHLTAVFADEIRAELTR